MMLQGRQQAYPDIGPESNIPEMQGVPALPLGGGRLPMASTISGVMRQLPSAGQGPGMPQDLPSALLDQAGSSPEGPHPTEQGEQAPIPPSPGPSTSTAAQAGYNLAPPTPLGAPGVTAPQQRDSRRQVISDLLAKFTYSLANAYSAPYGKRLGAALMGPYAYEERKHKLELERSQELQRTAAVEKMGADIARQQAQLPGQIEESTTRALRNRGIYDETRARIPNIQAQTDLTNARTDLTKAQADKTRMMITPNGVFRVNPQTQQLEQMPGADTVTRIQMTPDLLKSLGLPAELEGSKLRPQDINSLRPQFHEKLFKSSEGVMLYNEDTGTSKKLGDLPPPDSPGTFTPLLDPYGQIIAFFNPANGRTVATPIPGARRAGEAQATITRTDTFDQLHDDTELLRELANKHQNVIGPISGTAIGYLRNVIDLDPEINAMYRLSDNMADILLRARSGAQINEQEFQRLRTLVPNPRGARSKFFTDLEQFATEVEKSRRYLPKLQDPANPAIAPETPGRVAADAKKTPPAPAAPPKAADQIRAKFGKKQGQP